MVTSASDRVVFWLDEDDNIVRVNDVWDRFALANEGEGCSAGYVLGRRLRDFICGETTQILLDTLIVRARALKTPFDRGYRCDSPTTKRFMQMRIVPEEEGLRFEHWVVRTEPMRAPVRFVHAGLDVECVVRCSMCNRLSQPHGWSEPDATSGLPSPQHVIYGVCPDCQHALGLPRVLA